MHFKLPSTKKKLFSFVCLDLNKSGLRSFLSGFVFNFDNSFNPESPLLLLSGLKRIVKIEHKSCEKSPSHTTLSIMIFSVQLVNSYKKAVRTCWRFASTERVGQKIKCHQLVLHYLHACFVCKCTYTQRVKTRIICCPIWLPPVIDLTLAVHYWPDPHYHLMQCAFLWHEHTHNNIYNHHNQVMQ